MLNNCITTAPSNKNCILCLCPCLTNAELSDECNEGNASLANN